MASQSRPRVAVHVRDLRYPIAAGKELVVDGEIVMNRPGLTLLEGENGSGKSTLLAILAGEIDSYRGSVEVMGVTVESLATSAQRHAFRSMIGIIPQREQLLRDLTAYANLNQVLIDNGVSSRRARDARIMDALRQVSLEGVAHEVAGHMSGGQRQRLKIAKVLVRDTAIILADEPTNDVDAKSRDQIVELLKMLAHDKPVIVATHDEAVARECGDRFVLSRDRRLEPGFQASSRSQRPSLSPTAATTPIIPPARRPRLATIGLSMLSMFGLIALGASLLANTFVPQVRGRLPVTVYAGGGGRGFAGDGGPAATAKLDSPTAIAFGPDGDLYVADSGNHRLRRISKEGAISTTMVDGLIDPAAVAVNTEGTVVVSDLATHQVRSIDSRGIVSTTVGVDGRAGSDGDGAPADRAHVDQVVGLAFERDGTLLLADRSSGTIRQVSRKGIIDKLAHLALPQCLAVSPDGTVYASDGATHTVRAVRSGMPIAVGGIIDPRGVAADRRGRLAIADARGGRVYLQTYRGVTIPVLGGGHSPLVSGVVPTALELRSPTFVTFDPAGNLYVIEQGHDRILRLPVTTLDEDELAFPSPSASPSASPSPAPTPTRSPNPSPSVTVRPTATPTPPPPTAPPAPPTPSPIGGVQLLSPSWSLTGSSGKPSAEQYQEVAPSVLQGRTTMRIEYNLHGLTALPGDASAIIIDQGGNNGCINQPGCVWHLISLSDYGRNGANSTQVVYVPLSAFPGLDPSQNINGTVHTRFWCDCSYHVDIVSLTVS